VERLSQRDRNPYSLSFTVTVRGHGICLLRTKPPSSIERGRAIGHGNRLFCGPKSLHPPGIVHLRPEASIGRKRNISEFVRVLWSNDTPVFGPEGDVVGSPRRVHFKKQAGTENLACSLMDSLFSAPKSLLFENKIPDIIPREILEKSLWRRRFPPGGIAFGAELYEIPCKIPCLQGIRVETGATTTASPASHSGLY
jgi:hypothetical protein